MKKYPDAQVMKAVVNESAHLFQAVKKFVGHLDRRKKSLIGSFNVMAYKVLHDLEQSCSFLYQYPPHTPTPLLSLSELLSVAQISLLPGTVPHFFPSFPLECNMSFPVSLL